VKQNEGIPGEFVTSVTIAEVIVSTGVQLIHVAHDIAFTDAAFGEAWAVETANRMASLSELLNVVYKRMPRRTLEIVVDLPEGMIGQIAINPDYVPDSANDARGAKNAADVFQGDKSSIDDFPF